MPLDYKLLDSAGLATARGEPLKWLWNDYLARGMITLLTSRWKAGKTTLLSLLLERLSSKKPLCGDTFKAWKTIVVSEESAEIWHERAAALGIGSNVSWLCRPYIMTRPQPEDWRDLILKIYREPIDFVAFDTLSYFLPGDRENHPAALQQALEPLRILTRDKISVLLMHHPKKTAANVELSPRGCGVLTSFVDILLSMDLPRNAHFTDRRRVFRCTSRLGGSSERTFELTPDGRDYLLVPEAPGGSEFIAGWEVLKTVLEDADGDVTWREALQTWPLDHEAPPRTTLQRWLQQAFIDGRVTRQGRGRAKDPYRYGLSRKSDEHVTIKN